MSWPAPSDYDASVQDPQRDFLDPELQQCALAVTALGLPKVATGNFAAVYQLRSAQQRFAVRCFLREVTDQHRRYNLLSEHLAGFHSPYLVGFKYIPQGILVKGRWYPIVKMEWAEGRLLHTVVQDALGFPGSLLDLAKHLRGLVAALTGLRMAHGDLQHGNLLVTADYSLRLVDYDGMFVPRMKGEKAPELGHADFQHPQRTARHFDDTLDNFPALVIFLSLRALASDAGLWRFHTGDNLIFTRSDFEKPEASPVLNLLKASRDPAVQKLAEYLIGSCRLDPAEVPALEALLGPLPVDALFPKALEEKRRPVQPEPSPPPPAEAAAAPAAQPAEGRARAAPRVWWVGLVFALVSLAVLALIVKVDDLWHPQPGVEKKPSAVQGVSANTPSPAASAVGKVRPSSPLPTPAATPSPAAAPTPIVPAPYVPAPVAALGPDQGKAESDKCLAAADRLLASGDLRGALAVLDTFPSQWQEQFFGGPVVKKRREVVLAIKAKFNRDMEEAQELRKAGKLAEWRAAMDRIKAYLPPAMTDQYRYYEEALRGGGEIAHAGGGRLNFAAVREPTARPLEPPQPPAKPVTPTLPDVAVLLPPKAEAPAPSIPEFPAPKTESPFVNLLAYSEYIKPVNERIDAYDYEGARARAKLLKADYPELIEMKVSNIDRMQELRKRCFERVNSGAVQVTMGDISRRFAFAGPIRSVDDRGLTAAIRKRWDTLRKEEVASFYAKAAEPKNAEDLIGIAAFLMEGTVDEQGLEKARESLGKAAGLGADVAACLKYLEAIARGRDKPAELLRQHTGSSPVKEDAVPSSLSSAEPRIIEAHDAIVWSVAFSPDSRTLATASEDMTVKLWDVQTGDLKRTLRGHGSLVRSVVFAPDGKTLATGSFDKTLKIWDPLTGMLRLALQDTEAVFFPVFSPDGKTLVTGSGDEEVRIWNLQKGVLARKLKGPTASAWSAALSPDGKVVACGPRENTVFLWELSTGAGGAPSGRLLRTLKGHTNSVNSVAFSPDGKALASASADRTVRLWDVGAGDLKQTLTGHGAGVFEVAFTPDSGTLASASGDRTVRLWDARTGELKRVLNGGGWCVAISPDGKVLATGGDDRRVRLWDLQHLPPLRRYIGREGGGAAAKPPSAESVLLSKQITGAAFTGDLESVKATLKSNPELLNTRSGDTTGSTPLHFAAKSGNKAVADYLLSKGADVNAANNDGLTPLHFAVNTGDMDIVRLLLDKHADVNMSDNGGHTPLHQAASRGQTDIVRLLLAQHADGNVRCKHDQTASDLAVRHGHNDIAELLRPRIGKFAARWLVETSQTVPQTWRYTFERPADKWYAPEFNDSTWKEGQGGFGTEKTPGAVVRTVWDTADIWLRREFDHQDASADSVFLHIHHDDDAEIYLNGKLIAPIPSYTTDYVLIDVTETIRGGLKPGRNVLAVHCRQTSGAQYIDVGLRKMRVVEKLETSQTNPQVWRYTIEKPADNWYAADFDDSAWKEGPGGFGIENAPGAVVRTLWNSADIWLRREFELHDASPDTVFLHIHHNKEAEIYLNGQRIATFAGWSTEYLLFDVTERTRGVLKCGKNRLAVHCHQTSGGQHIDVGFQMVGK